REDSRGDCSLHSDLVIKLFSATRLSVLLISSKTHQSAGFLDHTAPDPIKPRPVQPRRDAPLPERCSMIPAAQENSSVCTDDAFPGHRAFAGSIIVAVVLSIRWN
ncbi:hypothetical protein FBUS_02471, partial [Fasciolopsis buskii]